MKRNDMTVTRILCGLLLLGQAASAQTNRGPQPAPAPAARNSSAMSEASRVLERARSSGQQETAAQALERASDSGNLEGIVKAGGSSSNAAEKALAAAADTKLAGALKNVSTEEGRTLLAQSSTSAPTRAPEPGQVIPEAKVVPAKVPDAGDVKPQPLKPVPLNPPANKEPARTVITSQGAAFFDSKQAMGVFMDDVVVSHPQFHLTSEVLEVYMIKESDKAATTKSDDTKNPNAPPIRPANVLPGEKGPAQPDSNIRQAIAKGPKVVIQKLTENGEPQIGICRHATYVGATGDIIMRDFPQVQRGTNVIIATDPSTVMTILQNGEFKAKGPTRTAIIQEGDKNIAPAPKPAADANAAAVTPTVQSNTSASQ